MTAKINEFLIKAYDFASNSATELASSAGKAYEFVSDSIRGTTYGGTYGGLYTGANLLAANPYVLGVGVLTLTGGAAALVYKYANSSDASQIEDNVQDQESNIERRERIKNIMGKYLITDYYLPLSADEKTEVSVKNQPQPIFDEKTKKDIAIVATKIKNAINQNAPPPNLILKGVAGTGKTMLARAFCEQNGIGRVRIPPGVFEKLLKTGSHIIALREINFAAEECPMPVYLIIDDGEELVAKRATAKAVDKQQEPSGTQTASWLIEEEKLTDIMAQRRTALVNEFLEIAEKPYRKNGVIITTNRFNVIDPAVISRTTVLSIDPPDMEQRKQIIITHLPFVFKNDQNYLSFFHKGRLEYMANNTEGFTGRNLVKMLEDIEACVALENGDITQDIVDAAILGVKAAVDREKADPTKGPTVSESFRQLAKSTFSALSFAFKNLAASAT